MKNREKLAYGLGDLSLNVAYTTVGFYFIFFLVNVAGLPAEWAGIIFLIARLWDAVTDYAMGVVSDRTITRWGRRRPYIIGAALPLAATFILLWIVPFNGRAALFIYYLAAIMIFNTAFTVVSVPYGALMPELTNDYDERTSLSAFRMGSSFIGNLVAAAGVALIVDVIFPGESVYRTGFLVMGGILGTIIFGFLLFPFFGTREPKRQSTATQPGFLESLRAMVALKEFRFTLGLFLFNLTGLDIFMALVIFYLKDVLAIPEELTFVIMGIPLVTAVAFAPLWVGVSKRLGKRYAYLIAVGLFAICLAMFNLIPPGAVVFTIVMAAFTGIAISALQIIPFSILPDVIEFDESKNSVRREGAFYGVSTFLYKLASAAAVAIASTGLGLGGYVEGSDIHQPVSALTAIRVIFTGGTVFFLAISAFLAWKLPITKERFDEAKRKAAGKAKT